MYIYNNQYPYFYNSMYRQYYNLNNRFRSYQYPCSIRVNNMDILRQANQLRDYGPLPYVVNIEEATKQNNNFRLALWTGQHLQLTLMSINVGDSIGLESHPNLDQFIRIEEGQGLVLMGDKRNELNFRKNVFKDYAFIIPAGKWHNLINTGNVPIKLYSIYAPVQHPYGTVHVTTKDAEAAEQLL